MTDFQKYYQDYVLSLFGWNENIENAEGLHRAIGIKTELAEIINAFKHFVRPTNKVDLENVKEEIGDCFFYLYSLKDCDFIVQKDVKVAMTDFEKMINTLELADNCLDYFTYSILFDYVDSRLQFIHNSLQTICNLWGFTFEEVIEANIRKLKTRHKEGYSSFTDLNRDLEAEKQALQSIAV